jgi:cardiolipin synthase
MVNLPNAITLLRIALVPVIGVTLWRRQDLVAVLLFGVSAVSDWLDGFIARRFDLRTGFGAVADPLADKATMLTVAVVLALQHALPWWLAAAIVARDLVIVGGAVAYRWRAGSIEMAPTRISKINTALQFLLLCGLLAQRAGAALSPALLQALMLATLATIVASGVQYVVDWSRKARQLKRP